jgi:phospholipid/cholesterol/gamma-HCH transport system substrate-binding protein
MNFNKEFKLGLLTTFTLLILYLGFNFLKGKKVLANNHIYYVRYENAQGLTNSSKVMLNGCPVGKVQSVAIMPDKDYVVQVELAIRKDIKITEQTIAKLASNNILGNKVIELIVQEGKPLQSKGMLQSVVEQDFQALFKEHTVPTLQDAKAISELAGQFMQTLVENTDRINNIFNNLELAAQQMRDAISFNQKDLGIISKNITEVTQVLADQEIGIRPLIKKMNQLALEIECMELRNLSVKIDHILANLASGTLHNSLNQVLVSLDDLLIDFKNYPSRYIHFSIFGRRPKKNLNYARKFISTKAEVIKQG